MNFSEVTKGMSKEKAKAEADRCLQCTNKPCIDGCPVHVNIPDFIKELRAGNTDKALSLIKKTNNLPAICGRVCPQEEQCQKHCILNNAGKPIQIGKLERFAADNGNISIDIPSPVQKKVAIVGSGPAGLSCAADLAMAGIFVTVYESLHDFGGVLRYGIPEFRLPNTIIEQEIKDIEQLGVSFIPNTVIGKTISLNNLTKQYDAVFIGVGAGLPLFLNIPGEELVSVYSANEYLTRVNLMQAYKNSNTPILAIDHCVVIGGGNVALDAARCAKRLGSKVTILYRRTKAEMPARVEEVEHAEQEGIIFKFLSQPVEILGKESVTEINYEEMRLSLPDSSGRPKPLPTGIIKTIDCDGVIIAVGTRPNPLLVQTTKINTDQRGRVVVDENLQTSMQAVYAGGDIVSGSATVIKAMGDGKKAAESIFKLFF